MFVVSGEALMDVFDAGPTATGQSLDARIGGSPLNVAIGLARLQQPVEFFGAVGRGFLGERLMRALNDEQVGTAAVQRPSAPTTLGLVGLDAQGVADYAFYGESGAERLLRLDDLEVLQRVAPQAAAYHFGSYAMVIEPAGKTLRALAERSHRRSLVAYDVNVRLNVQPDLQRWRAVLDAMVGCTHLLKMSQEDFEALFPGRAAEEAAGRWLARGVTGVIITRGGEGAVAWTAAGRIDVAPVPTTLVDTVGAGDTFQAALLTALAEAGRASPTGITRLSQDEWSVVLGFAARAAAITCSRRGADLPRRAEL
jgi:fructokinase